MHKLTKNDIDLAAETIIASWTVNRRVCWFAKVRGVWVPSTALYREASTLNPCHTYRGQGALETLGFRVRRFKPRKALRLQLEMLLFG